ncbi:MAG: adenine-specific DNA-methyltransferase [Halomonadaceae bacterium T82-2]|nr:MAG: adenine-specific DNA-methyltransferase [Halomonadaceae bacterium T82-2]
MMDKLKMHSPNLTEANIAKLAELFPSCVTEARDEQGRVKQAIDFDQLRQELSDHIVEGPQERYRLDWPGKREALLAANAPISKALRPSRERSVDFESTGNVFIEGDNLDALKLLQESHLNKVKVIFIDPPYNTGSDFVYRDEFFEDLASYQARSSQSSSDGSRLVVNAESNGRFHSDWLSMMYSRLRLARNLLKENGCIFIAINDCEYENLKKVAAEVFGEANFIATIVWEKVHTRKNSSKYFSVSHDYIVCFAKEKAKWDRKLVPRDNTDAYRNPDDDPKGPWKPDPITAHNYYSADYFIEKPDGTLIRRPCDRYWAFSEDSWKQKVRNNEVIWGEGDAMPMVKRYLSDVQDGLVPITLFSRTFAGDSALAKKELSSLLGVGALFDYPKPSLLVKRLLQISTRDNDIVLDFFAGSSTTAHAVMDLNREDGGSRRFIMVQIPERIDESEEAFGQGYRNIAEVSRQRIMAAGRKVGEGETRLDVGFRYFHVDTANLEDVFYSPDAVSQPGLTGLVDNIKKDRTPEDLLFQVLLDWGVDLSLPISRQELDGKTVFFVDGAEKHMALAACFDLDIDEAFVKQLAEYEPLRVVFRDAGFASDSVKINVEQIFAQKSPNTDVKVI